MSGNKSKFGGLSKLKNNDNKRIKKPLDENRKEIPTAMVMWGKAINGNKSLFNLVKKFEKYNFANIAWDNIKEIKVDKIPTIIVKKIDFSIPGSWNAKSIYFKVKLSETTKKYPTDGNIVPNVPKIMGKEIIPNIKRKSKNNNIFFFFN